MTTISKLYLHRATAAPPGTFPSSSALGGTPTVTASGASTLRWLDGTISGVAQTSAATNTDGTANAQTAWHTRHVSAPLAAQTISAQTITYSLAASEGNAASNFNPSIYISLWRPSTGAEVGSILAVGTITATEPGTTQTATSGTGTSTSCTAQDGDVIIIETWRKSVAPGATTARANTTFYDGTTEASTTNVASFVSFTTALTLLAIAPAPTALALTWTGATPTVSAPAVSHPTALSMTLTGATPTVNVTNNVSVAPTVLAMTVTGATPTVSTPVQVSPPALALTFTGATPTVTVTANQFVVPTALALTLTGATPTVLAPAISLPGALSLVLAGATPTVSTPVQVTPDPLSLTLTGATPTVSTPIVVNPSALALAIAFGTPGVSTPVAVAPSSASLALTLATPTVTVSGGTNIVVTPAALAMLLAGAVPSVSTGAVRGASWGRLGIVREPEEDDTEKRDKRRRARAQARQRRAERQMIAKLHTAVGDILMVREQAIAAKVKAEDEWLLGLIDDDTYIAKQGDDR